jgi:hypothetical protein
MTPYICARSVYLVISGLAVPGMLLEIDITAVVAK